MMMMMTVITIIRILAQPDCSVGLLAGCLSMSEMASEDVECTSIGTKCFSPRFREPNRADRNDT